MKTFVFLLACLAASAVSGAEPSVSIGEQRANFTLKMFLDLCMSTRGEPTHVEGQATRLGFRPLVSDAATRFTGPRGGRAWSVQVSGGLWALALSVDGVCSVYARQTDARTLENLVVSWLPGPDSGFNTEQEPATTSENGLRTIAYQIRRGEQPYAVWVLSNVFGDILLSRGDFTPDGAAMMPNRLVNTDAWRRPPLRGSWSSGAGYLQR